MGTTRYRHPRYRPMAVVATLVAQTMSDPQNPYQPPAHPPGFAPDYDAWGQPRAQQPRQWQWHEEDVQAEMKRLNQRSLLLGVPGLILQGLSNTQVLGDYTGLLALPGLMLLLAGLSFYARSRGRSPWFAALAFLSLLGLIILAALPRRCLICGGKKAGNDRCSRCQAPMVMRG